MDNFKRNYLKRTLSLVLAVIMIITLVPLGVFAQGETGLKHQQMPYPVQPTITKQTGKTKLRTSHVGL